MCIIAVKPSGSNLPDIKTLKNCWDSNRDGAGIAISRPNSQIVTISKGFMKFKLFLKEIERLNIQKKDQAILHFRIATHGLCDQGNTHPFPLTKDLTRLRLTNLTSPIAVAHNGIFGNMPKHDTFSDTQKFISGILADKHIIDNIETKAIQELIRGYCGSSSKLAILKASKLFIIGDFKEDKGCYYSNSGFKAQTLLYGWSGHGSNLYDSYDDFPETDISEDYCVLCGDKQKLTYSPDEQAFLCNNCQLQYNSAMYNK